HHTKPMLGAYRAAEVMHDVVHGARDFFPAREEHCVIGPFRHADVEMDIAVADVSERNGACARYKCLNGLRRGFHEFGNARDGNGNVVLDRPAFRFLCFRNAFAQTPKCCALRFAFSDDGIGDVICQCTFDCLAQPKCAPLVASINTYQGDLVCSGSAVCGMCASTKSSPMRGTISKAETSPPVCSCRRASKLTAAAGEGIATNAVTRSAGLANSFNAAAVMTPSVPSAPTNNCFRS